MDAIPFLKNRVGQVDEEHLVRWIVEKLKVLRSLQRLACETARDIDRVYASYCEVREVDGETLQELDGLLSIMHDYGSTMRWSPSWDEIENAIQRLEKPDDRE